MADYKLASQRLSSGGGSTPITGKTISAQATGQNNIKAPMLNVNAANVNFTPLPVPSILIDKSLDVAVKNMDNMSRAAFLYNERQEKAQAQEMILAYQNTLRSEFLGTPDENGQIQGGYANTKLNEASNSFNRFNTALDASFDSILEGVGEGVKSKAITGMARVRDQYRDKATQHNVTQFEAYERDLQFKKKDVLLQSIEDNGVVEWTNGNVMEFIKGLPKEQDKLAFQQELATNTLRGIYNGAREAASTNVNDTTPSATAFNRTEKAFQAIKPQLSREAEVTLQHWINQRRDEAVTATKREAKKREDILINKTVGEAPEQLQAQMSSNNWELFNNTTEVFRKAVAGRNSDTLKASNAVVSGITGAIGREVQSMSGTVSEKEEYAKGLLKNVLDNPNLNSVERIKIQNTVDVDIRNSIYRQQNTEDMRALDEYLLAAHESTKAGKVAKPQSPPPNTLAHNIPNWEAVARKQEDMVTKGVDGSTQKQRKNNAIIAGYKLSQGIALTKKEESTMLIAEVMGEMTREDRQEAFRRSATIKNGTYTPTKIRQSTEYKNASKLISNSSYAMTGLAKPNAKDYKKDPGGLEKAQRDYEHVVMLKKAEATQDLEAKMQEQKANFNYMTWYSEYAKSNMNLGNIITAPDDSNYTDVLDNPVRKVLNGVENFFTGEQPY